jgi:hypothetical protein
MEYTKLGRAGLDVSRILPRLHELRRRQCVAPIVRPNRARADPDAHELSHRAQHDQRQCATSDRLGTARHPKSLATY